MKALGKAVRQTLNTRTKGHSKKLVEDWSKTVKKEVHLYWADSDLLELAATGGHDVPAGLRRD